jgi:hypothetical protein
LIKKIDEILQMPTHSIERWIFKANIKVKESIEQNIIPAHQPNVQPNRPRLDIPDNHVVVLRNFLSRTITSFFQQNHRPPDPDPYIPEPPNDNRPP